MRENFIISSDKNNGYPSFSDSVDLENTDFCKNKNQFIANGINYPIFKTSNLDSNNMTKSGYLTPVVDFRHLQEVLVILELKDYDPAEADKIASGEVTSAGTYSETSEPESETGSN